MAYKTLLFEQDGPLAQVTLNRPQVGNALDAQMASDLMEAMLLCDEDPQVRAVLLSGAGKTFCVGGDLKHFEAHIDHLSFHIKQMIVPLHAAISRLAHMDAPVVAAAHGNVAGAGLSLLCAADIVLAAESSTFTMAYTAVGLSPDGSLSYFLPRLVGLRRALDLMLSNRRLTAQEALAVGLVSRVVPDARLMEAARGLADQLASGATRALGAAKRLIRSSWNQTLETQMEFEAQSIAEMARSADFREGVAAFMEKRPPVFAGK